MERLQCQVPDSEKTSYSARYLHIKQFGFTAFSLYTNVSRSIQNVLEFFLALDIGWSGIGKDS